MKNFLLKPKLSIAMVLEKKSLDPCKASWQLIMKQKQTEEYQ